MFFRGGSSPRSALPRRVQAESFTVSERPRPVAVGPGGAAPEGVAGVGAFARDPLAHGASAFRAFRRVADLGGGLCVALFDSRLAQSFGEAAFFGEGRRPGLVFNSDADKGLRLTSSLSPKSSADLPK